MSIFSIIIPTYNSERFIKGTIDSVLNQTFKDFELIIIDDGSKDTTLEIIKELSKNDARIKIIETPNSGGPTVPINIGLNIAKGKYITFLDHDDKWKLEKLEILNSTFINNPNVGFIATNVEILNEYDNSLVIAKPPIKNNKISIQNILSGNYFNTFSMLAIKKEVIDKVGYLDTNLFVFADYDIIVRMITNNIKYLFLSIPLVTYRIHKKNASAISNSAIKRINDLETILSKHQKIFNENKRSLSIVMQAIGRIHLNLGDKKNAIKYFKKSAKYDPMNPAVYIRLFSSYAGEMPYRFFRKINNLKNAL